MENAKKRDAYSRWASEHEIKTSLCPINFNDSNPQYGGIPLFANSDTVYVADKDSHSLIIGSTGSKKTRLIGMPALQLYAKAGESFIATDPKAELYERTLPLLKQQGYKTFVLNLRDPSRSNCWNPFAIPYHFFRNGKRDEAVSMVSDLSDCIVKKVNSNTREPYWEESAASLLAGLILILFEYADADEIHFKSLHALRAQGFRICNYNKGEGNPFIREHFLKYVKKNPFLISMLSGTAEVCESTRGCILSVFDQALRPFFCQDNLINMLSSSELDMSSIGTAKTAVFLIIPDENTLYNQLVSVFVKQCYAELVLEAQRQPAKTLPLRVNFLLDEFANLPQISDFPAMITASRSRNIRFNLLIQSIKQLQTQYGYHTNTIKGNCENWVFLHSRELELLNEITGLCGKKNVEESLVSVSLELI